MITFKQYSEIVSKISKKLKVSKDVASAALIKAQQKGIDPLRWQKYMTMLQTFVKIAAEHDPSLREQVKVESVLKYELSSKEIGILKRMRDGVVKKNPDMKPIDDKHLHVTLASGAGWKKLRPEYKDATFSDPDFRIEFESPKRVESGNSVSWYVKVKQQKQFKDYVTDLLQSDPDPKRVFHVSIANKTGKVGDSVATV